MKNKKQVLALLKCCICIGGSIGIVNNCIGIYFSSIAESLKTGVGSISITVTLLSLASAFSAPVLMRLIRHKIPINRLMSGGVLLVVCGYLIMSFAGSVWLLYIAGVIIGIGACCFSNLPITLILHDWYGEKIGSVTGIAMGFGGIFGAAFNPVFSNLITSLGWNNSLRIQALIMLVLVFPCALFSSMDPDKKAKAVSAAAETDEKTAPTVISRKSIILLTFAGILFACQAGMNSHFSALGVDLGYSLQFSAVMLSAAMLANVSFKLIHGTLADVTTPFLSSTLCSVIGFIGTLSLLLFHGSATMMLAGAFLYGAYFSVSTVGISLLSQSIAKERYGEVYSRITMFSTVAYALSLSVYGMIRDFAGSYLPSLGLVIVLSCLAIICTRLLKKSVQ